MTCLYTFSTFTKFHLVKFFSKTLDKIKFTWCAKLITKVLFFKIGNKLWRFMLKVFNHTPFKNSSFSNFYIQSNVISYHKRTMMFSYQFKKIITFWTYYQVLISMIFLISQLYNYLLVAWHILTKYLSRN